MSRGLLTILLLMVGGLLGHQGWEAIKRTNWFPLETIHIRGLVNIPNQVAMQIMDTPKGTNLLTIDPENIRSRLLSLPWIHSVRVKRLFPSTLTVVLSEKSAVGLGRKDDRLMVLDEYGMPIKPYEKTDPLLLPVVTPTPGPNQAAQVVWILNLLDKQAWIKDQISEAVGQPGGGWILYTRKGVKLLLSNRAEQELSLLHRLQKRYKILDLRIRQVELRIANRISVRPEPHLEPPLPEKFDPRRQPPAT
ncbi:MAG: FtsQ-type POTRA domain-containing protein [Magnetococcales bacterium]|nr:FtsQ-type POTRA domain-containing protein [Magnetococcales bacterium]